MQALDTATSADSHKGEMPWCHLQQATLSKVETAWPHVPRIEKMPFSLHRTACFAIGPIIFHSVDDVSLTAVQKQGQIAR